MLGLNVIYWSAGFERRALGDLGVFILITFVLTVAAVFARWRRARAEKGMELRYQDELPPVITSLNL